MKFGKDGIIGRMDGGQRLRRGVKEGRIFRQGLS